jgi:hypothetical protein
LGGVASLQQGRYAWVFGFAIAAAMFSSPVAGAQTPAVEAGAADGLLIEQEQIADKFVRLENTLLRMAELSAATDPRRAALLKKTVAQSKERLIGVQLESLVELLRNDQLSKAIENQDSVEGDLRALLELLLSENRAKRLESEKARIRAYLKRLNQIIKQQKGIQGRTAGAGEPKRLAGEQGKLADDTGRLAQDVQASEEAESASTESKDGKKPEEGSDPGEKPAAPGESKGDREADGKAGPADANKPNEAGQPQGHDGQPKEKGAEGQEGQQKSQDSQPGEKGAEGQQGEPSSEQQRPPQDDAPQDRNPARKRIEAATQRMRQAREKLEEAQRNEAVEQQEEAIRQLQEAKAQLEEILRQLREEEIEQVLTMLEARFVKMLQMQREVYVGTQRLDEASQDGMTHNQEIEAGRLSGREAEIVVEADKALALLREEGSAVAFPEAVSQVSDDMRQLVRRLQEAKVGQITQAIEEDVIAALEEIIEALKQAIEDAEERRRQQESPDGPPGEPQDPSLVDRLAELRMIRALQMRINTRTERYSKLVTGEQAGSAELVEALQRLAERQERVFQITREFEKELNR